MVQPRSPIIVVDAADYHPARRRRVHHLAIADIHAHMVHPTSAATLAAEEQQVARAQLAPVDFAAELALLGRIARQFEASHIEVHATH